MHDLDDYINRLRTNYHTWIKLTSRDITNIGYLTYFFSSYMKVFRYSLQLNKDSYFEFRGEWSNHNPEELIEQIKEQVIHSLLQLHDTYSPALPDAININTDSLNAPESKRIRRKGAAYAKEIVKYYQSYGVSLKISSDAEYKDERYVFYVGLLPGTDRKLISKYTDEVRRLLGVGFFFPDITSSSIKLIVSEKPLKENSLLNILESQEFKESKMEIPYAVGYDLIGEMVIADVAEFPHLLIGGATKSGKSSAIHSLLMSIVYKQPADKVKLLLLDFGSSRLKMFKDVPHMLMPGKIIGDINEGWQCILKLKGIMEQRVEVLNSLDMKSYDKKLKIWPSIVCVIDEFPAFIRQLSKGKDHKDPCSVIEDLLARARHVKIHFVLAAQDTTKGGIGIKNTNLAAGIAFRCTNWHTSKAIIGEPDAVHLSGRGSMYFRCDQFEGFKRLQGSFMPPDEIMDMLDSIKFFYEKKYDEVRFQLDSLQEFGNPKIDQESSSTKDDDKKYLEIVEWIQDKETVSNNQIKHKVKVGYDRANVFLGRLEEAGMISKNQRKGMKRSRNVDSNKVKEFLSNYGDTADAVEMDLEEVTDIPDIQSETGSVQVQSIEPSIAIPNVQAQEDDPASAMSKPKSEQCIKIDSDL